MVIYFNDFYPINKKTNIPFLGRYFNDVYFNGNPWIISTIALFNYYNNINMLYKHEKEFNNFINFLKQKDLKLSEQIDKNNGKNISVEKLTWNYAELTLINNKLNIF